MSHPEYLLYASGSILDLCDLPEEVLPLDFYGYFFFFLKFFFKWISILICLSNISSQFITLLFLFDNPKFSFLYTSVWYMYVCEYAQVPMAIYVQRLEEDSGVLLYCPVSSSFETGSITEPLVLFLTNKP